jgi:DDE superfamily endonuclease
MEDVLRV